jgi:hypothetical protein
MSVQRPASAAGTFSSVKVSLLGSAGSCMIRILPGKPVVTTTYISFH